MTTRLPISPMTFQDAMQGMAKDAELRSLVVMEQELNASRQKLDGKRYTARFLFAAQPICAGGFVWQAIRTESRGFH